MSSDRIRVLHLIDSYRIGGPGKTIINSARFIDAGRFELHAASFAPGDERLNEFMRAVRSAGIPYHGLVERKRFDLSQARILHRMIAREKIDILHTHGYKPDILGYLACRKSPCVKFVTTHHGWIETSLTQRIFTRAALALTRKMDGVVCVADHLQDRLPQRVRRSRRSTLIHNALVLADYGAAGRREEIRAGAGITEDEVLIGVVGRLSVEKGCLEALESLEMLGEAAGKVRLALIGDGPMKEMLQAWVDERRLGHKVLFAGHQSPVQPWFEALDMLLSPSRTEGLSNVLLEALAFRLPVVATRVGGNGEILRDGENGLLVEPLRPDLLAAAMERVLTDSVFGAGLARAGFATVQERFGFEGRMRKMESFYERILTGGDKEPGEWP